MSNTSLSQMVLSPKSAISAVRGLRRDVSGVKVKQQAQADSIRKLRDKIDRAAANLRARIDEQSLRTDGLEAAFAAERHAREALGAQMNTLATKGGLARLEQAVRRLEAPVAAQTDVSPTPTSAPARDDSAEVPTRLYLAMEDVLRGDEADIEARQRPYVQSLVELLPSGGVVADLGCGRGEFVSGLKAAGLDPVGVDTNLDALGEISSRGIAVEHMRADHYLESKADRSLDAVTAFHLIEHIPTSAMVHLFEEAFRTLRPGGVLVLETPNPENIRVGSHTFWLDPTHLKPVPPLLIETLLRDVGFVITESLRLSPYPGFEKLIAEARDDEFKVAAVTSFFGPQDFGVIATKRH